MVKTPIAHLCLECGTTIADGEGIGEAPEIFCTKEHKTAFDLRRYKRGAVFLDLFMLNRYKKKAKVEKVTTDLYAMADILRAEDKEERAGRQSWRTPTAPKSA
jgi:hypothetical protein